MFEITIKQTRQVKKTLERKWVVIGTQEVAREERFFGAGEPQTRIENVHGYTPEEEGIVTESVTVLTQVVDELDMAAVIKAINGLS